MEKILIGILICVVLAAYIGIRVFLYKKNSKKNQAYEIYHKKSAPPAIYRVLYRYLSSWIITRGYVSRVRSRFEMVEPGDIERIEKDTVSSILRVWGVAIVLCIVSFLFNFSLYSALLVIFVIYIANTEYLERTISIKKNIILHQMKTELENLQNNYNKSFDVSDAIYETAVNAPEPLRSHLKIIWDILQCDSSLMNQRMEEYNVSAPNSFLKDLLSCSKEISKYDDSKVDGISNYVRKLTVIINAVAVEERKEDDLRQHFSGHAFVCIFPVFLTGVLHRVSGSMFDLDTYFKGTYGIVATTLTFVISFSCYSFIQRKKNMDYVCASNHPILLWFSELPVISTVIEYLQKKDITKSNKLEGNLHRIGESMTVPQFLGFRILLAGSSFLIAILLCFSIEFNQKSQALTDNSSVSIDLIEGYSSDDEAYLYDLLTSLSIGAAGGKYDQQYVMQTIKDSGFFNSESKQQTALDVVNNRVAKYHDSYFKWYYLVFCSLVAFICSYIPFFLISHNDELVKMKADDEVMRFQNIISCMKNIERAGTKEILEEMELSASIFRNSLTECVDDYAADPLFALQNFMAREKDVDLLQRIAVKFIRADRVGVHDAFSNLDEEIYEAHKVREQKNRDYIINASTLTYMIAFIPVFAEIFLEMIIPMVMSTLTQMTFMNNF